MVRRKAFPVDDHCEIAVTTESMPDGWAVVASVKQVTGDTERVVDLPVPEQLFPTEADAEAFGVKIGRDWIQENAPRAV